MATRLKVVRSTLIQQCEEALAAIEVRIEQVKQEEAAYDWRVSAREALAEMTAAIDDPDMTEKAFDSTWYEVKRERPSFYHRMRDDQVRRKDVRTLLEVLKMNNDETVMVSTGDEAVATVLRETRKKQQA